MAQLSQEFAKIRTQGYALVHEELELGFVAAAAPIFNHNARVVAAISVGGPAARFQTERLNEIVDLTVKSAESISQKIGFTGPDGDATM
jgi:DNA-binding IclR family transcriptional regulator